jgi:hypothetical protein
MDLFFADGGRKDGATGKAHSWVPREAGKKTPEYLKGYIDLETKVIEHLEAEGVISAE